MPSVYANIMINRGHKYHVLKSKKYYTKRIWSGEGNFKLERGLARRLKINDRIVNYSN